MSAKAALFEGLTPLIGVFDMSASLAFYRDVLGFEVINASPPVDTPPTRREPATANPRLSLPPLTRAIRSSATAAYWQPIDLRARRPAAKWWWPGGSPDREAYAPPPRYAHYPTGTTMRWTP